MEAATIYKEGMQILRKSLSQKNLKMQLGDLMKFKLFAILLVLCFMIAGSIAEKGAYTVNVSEGTRSPGINTVGMKPYLTNETFFTLYHYMQDTPGSGSSTCNSVCADTWPPFYVDNLNVNPELNSKDFTVLTGNDGMKQIAYMGWPLYLYTGDKEPYQVNGQGQNNAWYATNVTGN